MILKIFDYGWGPEWPIKQIEHQLIHQYLSPLIKSHQRLVLINSTWYGTTQHDSTMQWLRANAWDIIVVISMIDAPIPKPSWFTEFGRPVIAIGNFKGDHYISLWLEIAARHIQPFFEHAIAMPFMCLNRKPHWHRTQLYQRLEEAGLLDQGLVSMGGIDDLPATRTVKETIVCNDFAPNGSSKHHGIANDISSLGDLSNWRRYFLNVVTETVFDVDGQYFVSEKIFKPILGCRPFLVYAQNGAEKWLDDQGFKSYLDDFADVSNLDLRDASNIPSFLSILCEQGTLYWQKKYLDLLPKIRYNLERFNQLVAQQRQHVQKGIACPI